jgi:hypothetical protein
MPKVGNFETISGQELRSRIDALGLTYAEAARQLGLTEDGLYKAMRGDRRVGRQTEIILGQIEELRRLRGTERHLAGANKRLAQYLYSSAPRRRGD